jgi:hypothetical protein
MNALLDHPSIPKLVNMNLVAHLEAGHRITRSLLRTTCVLPLMGVIAHILTGYLSGEFPYFPRTVRHHQALRKYHQRKYVMALLRKISVSLRKRGEGDYRAQPLPCLPLRLLE